MIDSSVTHVLQVFDHHEVSCLLTGGQACVIYGAAEFSKDIDFVVLADSENFEKIQAAARELKTEVIAIPPFEARYLDEGLTVHLRCTVREAADMRVDLMSKMRNVDPFPKIWERRSTLSIEGCEIHLLGVTDLVASKKTQRSKDWPMIQRLIEVHFEENKTKPDPEDIAFWLKESLTEKILCELAAAHLLIAEEIKQQRPLLEFAIQNDLPNLRKKIVEEIETEKEKDRSFWKPLKARLGKLRNARSKGNR